MLFCSHCGERALPLEEEGAANTRELVRERVRQQPYTTRDALLYPVRGQGVFVGVGAFIYLAVLQGLLFLTPFVGLGAIPLLLLILLLGGIFALLAAGLSFAVVRSTAAGGNEMPDWPDLSDLGERASDLFAAIVLGFMAVIPAIVLVQLMDCEVGLVTADVSCLLVLALGLVLGLPIWVPAFGAVGLFGNSWLAIRWDLHLRALVATWPGTVRISLALVAVHLVAGVVGGVLGVIPFLGGLVALAIDIYAWLAGMHFVGLLMRRHEPDLETIYFR